MARRPAPRRARERPHSERLKRFRFNPLGTRFRIYPHPKNLNGFATPSIIYINARPGTIGPGAEDSRIRVIDAEGQGPYKWKVPYTDSTASEPRWRPPYPRRDRRRKPVQPLAGTSITSGWEAGPFGPRTPSRRYGACSRSGSTTSAEGSPGSFKNRERPRLEIIPRAGTDNAWSGEGFLEFGYLWPNSRWRRSGVELSRS